MQPVKTRIAPSPTGDPHVGTAFIALFNYCFAKAHGGSFILRIEDTDQARSSLDSEKAILKALNWLGLSWSEGPDVGGPHGPYRQSERSDIYKQYANELLEKGHAFRCFCDDDRLKSLRNTQKGQTAFVGYDGHCKGLSRDDIQSRLTRGDSFTIRMDIPLEGDCVVPDLLRGNVNFPWSTVDMQVLLKSDGLPTYHLANVVDDHLMGITHVIRGEEWLSSTPKHLLLYQYFGWTPPQFIHLPLLRNPDKSKLSKRKNPTSILYYKDMGFLPEALLNYLGMMGWSMPDGRDKFTLSDMVSNFDITRVSLGGPIFDTQKLEWLNAKYLREDYTPKGITDLVLSSMMPIDKLNHISEILQPRITKLTDYMAMASFLFQGSIALNDSDLTFKGMDSFKSAEILQLTLWRLEVQRTWDKDSLDSIMRGLASYLKMKPKDFFGPFYVALTGKKVGPPLFDTMVLLGPDMTRYRLREAILTLGPVPNDALKALDATYQDLTKVV